MDHETIDDVMWLIALSYVWWPHKDLVEALIKLKDGDISGFPYIKLQ